VKVLIIKNVNIFKEHIGFEVGDINIEKEWIVDNIDSETEVLDGKGLYAVPGLIDMHQHGCNGCDFCDGSMEAFHTIAKYQASNGITSVCATTMTLEETELTNILHEFSLYLDDLDKNEEKKYEGANLCGIYLEGPFISKNKKGAQNSTYIKKPDVEMYHRLQKVSGNRIKVVTVAPEMEGAMEFIDELKGDAKDPVVVSIAHTEATYEQALNALQKGATQVTHLYNAMPPLSHREPGVIGAALDAKDCYVELICDGIHIHPSVIRSTFRMFGEDKIILISDSMMATGLSDGVYSLGKQEVKVAGRTAQIASSGAIAGSVTNLMDCVRFLVKNVGISLDIAIQCASVNPAKALGMDDQYGSIEHGKVANIVLLDQDLNLHGVILRGRVFK
jgi:N-acetylglucosamine-6-phosphate deacetylase